MTQQKPAKKTPKGFDQVRAAAVKALLDIEKGEQADAAIRAAVKEKGLRPIDLRFLSQLVNGATKMRRRLDHEIKFYLARPSVKLEPAIQNILRLGFYQLSYTDRVPDAAAVSESVNLARHFADESRARLVNAVMRSRLREPEKVHFVPVEDNPAKHLGDKYSYPDHFVEFCLSEFGVERTTRLLEHYNRPPTACYRVNFLKIKPEKVAEMLSEEEIEFSPGKYLPEFLHLTKSGLPLENELIRTGNVFVQNESSGLAPKLLNPRPGANVADLTAAPGGKATYMAIRMRNRGRITAIDKSRPRLELLVDNTQRLGIRIISPVFADLEEFSGGPFDRVLLDPPCTGWGAAGKHSDLRWSKTGRDIDNLVKVQTMMIDRAARLVKPGGILVYSTCTIIRNENDEIVEQFLLRNDKFEIESADRVLPSELVSERGFLKTYPDFDNLEGAFCARLKRRQNR